jgi:hypothetical protein
MHEQIPLMFQNPIQTPIQPVLLCHREIRAQQHIHGAVIEPFPVQPELAARIDQPVHHQQFHHLRPTHLFPAPRQLLFPEPIQFQLPPQLARQPAIAVWSRPPQLHLAQLHLQAVNGFGRHRPVFGKQAQRFVALLLLIEHRQRLTPGRLLAVVDLSEIQNAALRHFARLQPPAFFDAVIAMLLAVLDPLMTAQKHARQQNARNRIA